MVRLNEAEAFAVGHPLNPHMIKVDNFHRSALIERNDSDAPLTGFLINKRKRDRLAIGGNASRFLSIVGEFDRRAAVARNLKKGKDTVFCRAVDHPLAVGGDRVADI